MGDELTQQVYLTLKGRGASVLMQKNMPLIVGHHGKTHLIATKPLAGDLVEWSGEPIRRVRRAEDALALIGEASNWARWRLQRDEIVLKAVKAAMKHRQQDYVFPPDVLAQQTLYQSERGIRRQMAAMEQRGLLCRVSKISGYTIAPQWADEIR